MTVDSRILVKTVIHGFEVEFESDPSVEWCDCYITKGGYSGTLTFLEDHSELINDCGNVIKVSQHTIKAIKQFAEKNGY